MDITYHNSVEDYLAFAQAYHQRYPHQKRAYYRKSIVRTVCITAAFATLPFIIRAVRGQPPSVSDYTACAVAIVFFLGVYFLFYKNSFASYIEQGIRRHAEQPSFIHEACTLTITPDYITMLTHTNEAAMTEKRILWEQVAAIEMHAERTLLWFQDQTSGGLVIPHSAFQNDAVLREGMQQIHLYHQRHQMIAITPEAARS